LEPTFAESIKGLVPAYLPATEVGAKAQILDHIRKAVPKQLVVLGLPGAGKSVVLRAVHSELLDPVAPTNVQAIPVWVPGTAFRPPADFWTFLSDALLRALPEAVVPPPVVATHDDPWEDLTAHVRSVSHAGEDRRSLRRPVVFLIDDFDVMACHLNVYHFGQWRNLIEALRTHVYFVLASRVNLLEVQIEQSGFNEAGTPGSSWTNEFSEVKLGFLSREDALPLFEGLVGSAVPANEWAWVWEEAGGSPEFLAEAAGVLAVARRPGVIGTTAERFRSLFRRSPTVIARSPVLMSALRPQDSLAARLLANGAEADDADLISLNSLGLLRQDDEGKVRLFEGFASQIRDKLEVTRPSTPIQIDPATKVALVDGRVVQLSARECRFLECLLARSPAPVPFEELLASVWDGAGSTNAMFTLVSRLRLKIQFDAGSPIHLETVEGVGYRLR
jgi:hypothetical protein